MTKTTSDLGNVIAQAGGVLLAKRKARFTCERMLSASSLANVFHDFQNRTLSRDFPSRRHCHQEVSSAFQLLSDVPPGEAHDAIWYSG